MANQPEENRIDGSAAEQVESAKPEVKERDPLARLEAIRAEALGGTRTTKDRAVADAVVRIGAAVDSVKGTAEDKGRLSEEVAPVQAKMEGVVTETERRVEGVIDRGSGAKVPVGEKEPFKPLARKEAYGDGMRYLERRLDETEEGIRRIESLPAGSYEQYLAMQQLVTDEYTNNRGAFRNNWLTGSAYDDEGRIEADITKRQIDLTEKNQAASPEEIQAARNEFAALNARRQAVYRKLLDTVRAARESSPFDTYHDTLQQIEDLTAESKRRQDSEVGYPSRRAAIAKRYGNEIADLRQLLRDIEKTTDSYDDAIMEKWYELDRKRTENKA